MLTNEVKWLESRLGHRLKQLREDYFHSHCFEHGTHRSGRGQTNLWSQREVAAKLGVSKETLSQWENCARYPGVGMLLRWCDVLGVDLADEIRNACKDRVSR